jgi:hypothetical protein
LEHYARCRVLLDVASRQLNLRFKDDDALPFWMLVADDRLMHNGAEMLTRIAVLVYAAYRTTNALRPARLRLETASSTDGASTSSDGEDSDDNNVPASNPGAMTTTDDTFAQAALGRLPHDMLAQFIHEAVRGHRVAGRIIDQCWENTLRGNPRQRCE